MGVYWAVIENANYLDAVHIKVNKVERLWLHNQSLKKEQTANAVTLQ